LLGTGQQVLGLVGRALVLHPAVEVGHVHGLPFLLRCHVSGFA
jgi:hypothetical protein